MSSAPEDKHIRVLLVDDSPIIRLGLRSALEDYADILIAGEAGSAADGVAAVAKHKTRHHVLLDLHLAGQVRPARACRELLKVRPQTRVLILTSSSHERNVHDAIAAGAQGYRLKDNDGAALVAALRTVAGGSSVIDPSMAGQVLNLVKNRGSLSAVDKINLLSNQERRVSSSHSAKARRTRRSAICVGTTEKDGQELHLATIFTQTEHHPAHASPAALFVEAGRNDPA